MEPIRLPFSFNAGLVQQLRVAMVMFGRFLHLQYSLGDAFLKSSKDFIH